MKNVCVTRSTVNAINCGTMLLLICKGRRPHVLMEEPNPKVFENKTLRQGERHNGGFHFIYARTVHLKLISQLKKKV